MNAKRLPNILKITMRILILTILASSLISIPVLFIPPSYISEGTSQEGYVESITTNNDNTFTLNVKDVNKNKTFRIKMDDPTLIHWIKVGTYIKK